MKSAKLSKTVLQKTPDSAGVYTFWNSQDHEIYIGKAKNLKSRLTSYFSAELFVKTKKMMAEATKLTYIKTSTEFEALLLEANLVRRIMPKYNIELKDDKSPIYIGITSDRYPRILTARKTQLSTLSLKDVFGPYPEASSVKKILKYLRRIFPYSEHKLGTRPCIYSQIDLCNPCPNSIATKDQQKKYLSNIRSIKAILSGRITDVVKNLRTNMDIESKKENYEEAKELLAKIKALDYLTEERTPVSGYLENPNFAEDLHKKEKLDLKKIVSSQIKGVSSLRRIECFDVAHLAGTFPTASMVTFVDGTPDKSLYRHFKITGRKKSDDLDNMRSILERRKKRLDWGVPNLIIIDGGKGQLGVAKQVFGKDFPVVGLTKRYETLVFLEDGTFRQLLLKRGLAKNLVQRIRDEAHRFARSYHHLLVAKAIRV